MKKSVLVVILVAVMVVMIVGIIMMAVQMGPKEFIMLSLRDVVPVTAAFAVMHFRRRA